MVLVTCFLACLCYPNEADKSEETEKVIKHNEKSESSERNNSRVEEVTQLAKLLYKSFMLLYNSGLLKHNAIVQY